MITNFAEGLVLSAFYFAGYPPVGPLATGGHFAR